MQEVLSREQRENSSLHDMEFLINFAAKGNHGGHIGEF